MSTNSVFPDSGQNSGGGSHLMTSHGVINGYTDLRYKMSHDQRGMFIIFNNKKFDPKTKLEERTGTDVDAENLKKLFEDLGFKVLRFNDVTAAKMFEHMKEAAKQDHSACDCFGVAVLSHGAQGILYGTGCGNGELYDSITIESLIGPIKDCRSLSGKPKLFFFQACRGNQLDDGTAVVADSDVQPSRKIALIPQHADFLFAYSTTPGYLSWRHEGKGSWFIQALYGVFVDLLTREELHKVDILHILTHVNHVVAYNFESKTDEPETARKKQVPSIVSQLTKNLYFTKK